MFDKSSCLQLEKILMGTDSELGSLETRKPIIILASYANENPIEIAFLLGRFFKTSELSSFDVQIAVTKDKQVLLIFQYEDTALSEWMKIKSILLKKITFIKDESNLILDQLEHVRMNELSYRFLSSSFKHSDQAEKIEMLRSTLSQPIKKRKLPSGSFGESQYNLRRSKFQGYALDRIKENTDLSTEQISLYCNEDVEKLLEELPASTRSM